MRRSIRLSLVAAVAGLVVPVAASQTAVSAIDQDLVLSTTSGEPGTQVEVTSASCNTGDDGESYGYLWVRLVTGTAPAEVLAGSAIGAADEPARLVVPDWIDPDAPAAIEAACVQATYSDDFDELPTLEREWYDPIPFDVLPGAGAPVQTQTYSRTSLLAGQAFSVAASGCFLDNPDTAYVDVLAGSDLALRSIEGIGVGSGGEVEDGSFDIPTALVNGRVSIRVSEDSDGNVGVDIEELPTDLPPGTYTAVASCSDGDTTLLFEPQLIEITGAAPMDDVDLVAQPDSRSTTFAGGSCTAGEVQAWMYAEDLDLVWGEGDASRSGSGRIVSPTGLTVSPRGSAPFGAPGAARVLGSEPVDLVITPEADGSWSSTDDTAYDHALVGGFAVCGDPLADGFIYDDQAVEVQVEPVDTTTSTAVPTTAPAPAPANAVAGTPTYAG